MIETKPEYEQAQALVYEHSGMDGGDNRYWKFVDAIAAQLATARAESRLEGMREAALLVQPHGVECWGVCRDARQELNRRASGQPVEGAGKP